jgi:RNA polymerase sigma-54 factor
LELPAEREPGEEANAEPQTSQQLIATPQLQQSIGCAIVEPWAQPELGTFLADNPLLEREDAGPETLPLPLSGPGQRNTPLPPETPATDSPSDSPAEFDWLDSPSGPRRDEDEDSDYSQQAAGTPSLREHLMEQLCMTRLSARDMSLVNTLIAALDERGYLSDSLEEIAELLPPELEVDLDELAIALKYLQNFDPVGVGARTPAECLGLQLQALPQDTSARELATRIVREHLDELAARLHRAAITCDDSTAARLDDTAA